MLQTQRPVPDIRSSGIAVDPHDSAGIAVRITVAAERGAAQVAVDGTVVPGECWEGGQIARRNRAGARRSVEKRSCRHAGQAEAIVEGQERFPVDRLENQATAAAQHGPAVSIEVPGKAGARCEVLAIGVINTAHAVTALLNQSGCRVGIEVP